ncbi:ABC transporter permease [Conexibacter sp. CPCC 206217]|uniref:ABC transporter permease n=1 Tax=Conexibacter sp. CPCC 206217 TaxID=3064574 RepID=UPI00271770B9|nr:ABC transporter permease [Conexibacter sp. CPCC 206217]MDO8209605.1 ABC transporter permease [Conexibacter sp. CPCC 206217]
MTPTSEDSTARAVQSVAHGDDAAPAGHDAQAARASLSVLLERLGLPILFAIMVVVFCLLRPDTFATSANFQTITITQSVLVVLALALMIPLIGGRFDVSVGSTLGFSSILCAGMMSRHGWPLVAVVVLAIVVGVAIGLVNGVIVAYLGVNSLIATLGTATVISGLVQAYSKGIPVSSGLSQTLTDLGSGTLLGIPDLFVLAVVLGVIVWFGITQTVYGRTLFAVGSNLSAARLTGVRVKPVVLTSFVFSGVIAGVGGLLQIASTGNGDPTVGGVNFIVPAVAAVFLGATTWQPGKYNVFGTFLGLFFVGSMVGGLTLVGAAPWVTSVFNGAALVIAIAVSAQIRRHRTGSLEVGT